MARRGSGRQRLRVLGSGQHILLAPQLLLPLRNIPGESQSQMICLRPGASCDGVNWELPRWDRVVRTELRACAQACDPLLVAVRKKIQGYSEWRNVLVAMARFEAGHRLHVVVFGVSLPLRGGVL